MVRKVFCGGLAFVGVPRACKQLYEVGKQQNKGQVGKSPRNKNPITPLRGGLQHCRWDQNDRKPALNKVQLS